MKDLLAYGVELNLTHYGLLDLAVDVKLDDIRIGSVDQRLYLLCVYGECDLLATAVDHAGYQTLATERLSGLLAELGTLHCFELKCFHLSNVI